MSKHGLRFSATWGAGLSVLGLVVATLAGASGLQWVFGLLSALFLSVLGWRALAAARQRLLWRLRNRLLAVYVFIGLIPVLLLLLMGGVAAWILYGNVAVSLVTQELEGVQAELESLSAGVAVELERAGAIEGRITPGEVQEILGAHLAAAQRRYLGIDIRLAQEGAAEKAADPPWLLDKPFSGVVVEEGVGAALVSATPVFSATRRLTVVAWLPLDATVLSYLGGETVRVSLLLLRESASPGSVEEPAFVVGATRYRIGEDIKDERALAPPAGWWDRGITFFATQPTRIRGTGEPGPPLVLVVDSQVALLNRQLGSRLGLFSALPFTILTVVGVLFLGLEVAAVWIGVRMTRTITATVNDLQAGTEAVEVGNLSHRIRLRGHDQLSGLAQAFNSMIESIEKLVQESRERQRLENELEIARQVQEQLFPREVPKLKTLELVGRCRPARTVSGDYYDYGMAEAGKMLFAIGDISGKGISAALLMATIQSILRSQVYAMRLSGQLSQLNLAELASRVNRQLCATTSQEKYSTLFLGLYDDRTRRLTYTNAGHLPPIVLGAGRTRQLDVGGPVVGLFRDLSYEQASVQLEPGNMLVAFTDGLTEVENSYEEEYGIPRLVAFLERTADRNHPERVIDAVLAELQQWAPGIEPVDDCTMLVARVR